MQVFIDRTLSPDAQRARLADVAKRASAELIASGRASARFTRYVDGQEGAPETAVRADGVIVYQFHYIGEAVAFAITFLKQRASPGASGKYLRGFRVSVDGRVIDMAVLRTDKIKPGSDVYVFNVEPYSRKIDVAMSGNRPLKYRIQPGLFEDAAKAVRHQFGSTVSVKRVYTIKFTGQQRSRHSGRLIDSPALLITSL